MIARRMNYIIIVYYVDMKMNFRDIRELMFPIIIQILLLIFMIWIGIFSQKHPIQNLSEFLNVTVTMSGIVFGLLTMSVARLLEEHRKVKQELSNLANEMLKLLIKIRNEPELSKKRIRCRSKVWIFGYEGCGSENNAQEVIANAYNYFLKTIRYRIHLSKKLLLLFSLPGIGFLFLPIIIHFSSYYINVSADVVTGVNLLAIFFGSLLTIVGWLWSDRRLENEIDVMFNIRHTILSELYSDDYPIGFSKYG